MKMARHNNVKICNAFFPKNCLSYIPLFSEKSYSKESISRINEDDLITKNEDLAKTFGNIFSNIINKLGLEHVPDDEPVLPNIDYPVLKDIAKYEI